MRAFRFFALVGTIALHILAVFWIMSRPAGTPRSQGEPGIFKMLSVNLVAVTPEPSVAAPATPSSIDNQEIAKSEDAVAPVPVASSRDVQQTGLIPDYFPAKQLSRMPVALTNLDSLYPATAPGSIAGKLHLRLWVNESGKIDRLTAMDSDLPEEVVQMMLASFRQMLFKPGEINNIPVKVWVDIVVEYGDDSQLDDALSVEIKNVRPVATAPSVKE